ncbi:MAG: AAA family ATPase [Planctomycetes bacterium]|nr:AAA family ATPase [Planctomycetota bacterium]MCB9829633.1 AAA family ATPase [Planctomycetota bacterium]MCB9900120.1 AAA family ATPase [Planctomycetota bacterium]
MPKHFLLEELAGLAGVPVRQVQAWETDGLLGDVPRDAGKRPLYGFEHAERCVELGGRGLQRRLCVVNQKGGVGKTTTAFTLAAALADLGRRVLCVDLDAQANLTTSFGFDPDALERTSADLLTEDDVGPEDVILETNIEGVHAIPADIKLVNVEARIQDEMQRERILDRKLSPLYDRYHFILFDCPPNLSRVTINALCASEEVIVPIETQSYSIKAISDLTHTFTLLKRKMGHDLTVWLLPTKVDRSVKIATDILDALDDAFRGRLLDPIHDDPTLIRAPLLCEPITRSYPNAPSALEYARLGRFFTLHDAERAQWMGLTLAERRRIIEKAARDVAEEADLPPAIKKKRLWG